MPVEIKGEHIHAPLILCPYNRHTFLGLSKEILFQDSASSSSPGTRSVRIPSSALSFLADFSQFFSLAVLVSIYHSLFFAPFASPPGPCRKHPCCCLSQGKLLGHLPNMPPVSLNKNLVVIKAGLDPGFLQYSWARDGLTIAQGMVFQVEALKLDGSVLPLA